MNRSLACLLCLLLPAAMPVHGNEGGPPAVETIASYPHGSFLENLSEGSDGALLITSYVDRRLLRWTGEGVPVPLATLDVHPVGVLSRADGIVLSAHGASFLDGPAFVQTNQMLVLDLDGTVRSRIAMPQARFLNGLVSLEDGSVLVADSIAGRIWRFVPDTGEVSQWLEDPLLAPEGNARPGANGLKLHDGHLYVSNSSRGAIYRVRVDGGTPMDVLERVAQPGPIDDFSFLSDGSIAAATHGDTLIRIAADGTHAPLMSTGCDGCTSVAVFGPEKSLVVLTTGGLVEGGGAPARVLRLPSPLKP